MAKRKKKAKKAKLDLRPKATASRLEAHGDDADRLCELTREAAELSAEMAGIKARLRDAAAALHDAALASGDKPATTYEAVGSTGQVLVSVVARMGDLATTHADALADALGAAYNDVISERVRVDGRLSAVVAALGLKPAQQRKLRALGKLSLAVDAAAVHAGLQLHAGTDDADAYSELIAASRVAPSVRAR